MSITEVLSALLVALSTNFYTDINSRKGYALNECIFAFDKLGNSDDRFTAEECALFYQAAEALAHAGDVPAQGDPTCEQCHGHGCGLCCDDIYYRQEDAAEQFRRDRTWDRNANHG